MLKTVTLQEANGLLPLVQEHFLRIHVLLAHLQNLRGKKSLRRRQFVFDNTAETLQVIKKTCNYRKSRSLVKKINEVEELIHTEIQDLMRLGAVIKSLFPPHIDFLSIKNNEPVFLCWHGGEKEITHCHHVDESSPIRYIIAKKGFFGPHVVH
jgi:hypothetical protein